MYSRTLNRNIEQNITFTNYNKYQIILLLLLKNYSYKF